MELELTFNEDKAPGATSEWEKAVPIIADKDTVYAYLPEEVYSVGNYCELIHTLEHTKAKTVKLIMNNGGGYMDSMLSIRSAIQKSNAKVIAVLDGTVASAATMITMCCDEIEIGDWTSFMIHSSSGGTQGKHHETKAYMEFSDKLLAGVFNDLYKGFLSNKEINRVLEGKDLWLDKDEVLDRWKRKRKLSYNTDGKGYN